MEIFSDIQRPRDVITYFQYLTGKRYHEKIHFSKRKEPSGNQEKTSDTEEAPDPNISNKWVNNLPVLHTPITALLLSRNKQAQN